MLQLFANIYRVKECSCPVDVAIYEITKLYKNSAGNFEKTTDYLLSDMPLPKININDLGFMSVSINLLSKADINQRVVQCKEYGIL